VTTPAQVARLGDGIAERLLDADVLLVPDRAEGGDIVRVVGRGDDGRVDVPLHLVEHLPEVGEKLRHPGREPGTFLEPVEAAGRFVQPGRIHIDQGDDVVVARDVGRVGLSLPHRADHGNVQSLDRVLSASRTRASERGRGQAG
jgi:hypothetical protein